MPTVEESLCCVEQHKVVKVMSDNTLDAMPCITLHPGFSSICLEPWNLKVAYHHYVSHYGPMVHDTVAKYRYTAYRQFVCWCWGRLGRDIRVPLPACVVTAIRRRFPAANYTGFVDTLPKLDVWSVLDASGLLQTSEAFHMHHTDLVGLHEQSH